MFPVLFQNETLLIPTWHVFFLLAVLAALVAIIRQHAKQEQRAGSQHKQISRQDLLYLYCWAYAGAYLGARWLSVAIEQKEELVGVWNLQGVWNLLLAGFSVGPMTFYGGLLGGAAAGWFYLRWRNLAVAETADVVVPAIFLGLAIGRIGCFLNGDDYGGEVALLGGREVPWWAVKFPNHDLQIYRYPVQLWESFAGFAIYILAYSNYRREWLRQQPGLLSLITILVYGTVRFFLEFWRDDPRGWLLLPALSTSQGISLAIILIVGFTIVRRGNDSRGGALTL